MIESAASPSLIPGKIHAIRSWNLIPEAGTSRMLLGSLSQCAIWPTGPATAECFAFNRCGEAVPGGDCSCGIYALHPHQVEHSFFSERHEFDEVLGVVEAWGRVEAHEVGIRAEHARVVALLADASAPDDHLERVRRAARTYGVELVPIAGASQFERYVSTEVRGLGEEFVERLLIDSRTHQLEPRACGYMSRRGQPVNGFGYVFSDSPDPPRRFQNRVPTDTTSVDVIRVAGAVHREAALQAEALEPGRPLALVADSSNPHDPNAVAVWDAALEHHIGYVPRAEAAEIGSRLAAGRIARVDSVWQWRDPRTGRRTGLHMLISATPRIEFVGCEQLALGEDDGASG